MKYAIAGSRCPVYMAGIKYNSISAAANEADISQRWLHVLVKENNGAPIVIKNQFIVTDFWVRSRIAGQRGAI